VLATGVALFLCGGAHADETHVLQPNETVAGIARKFHVTVAEIAKANHLKNPDSVPDFTKLKIPSSSHHFKITERLHSSAYIDGDAVNVRVGPSKDRPVMMTCDTGQAITVTAVREDWAQIRLPSGRTGWIRRDLVKYGHADGESHPVEHVARHERSGDDEQEAPKKRPHPKLHVARAESDDKTRRTHKAAHKSAPVQAARHGTRKAELAVRSTGSDIVRTAYAYRGTPYRYGGSSRNGFDCSGFTSYLYGRKGVSLPHSARAQFETGKKVDRAHMKPGDLVFFHTVTSGISHVGMYVGNGNFVHASSRRQGGVRVDSLSEGYYRQAFRGARRVR
jgi:peptidoglycan endopeptidase LytF